MITAPTATCPSYGSPLASPFIALAISCTLDVELELLAASTIFFSLFPKIHKKIPAIITITVNNILIIILFIEFSFFIFIIFHNFFVIHYF